MQNDATWMCDTHPQKEHLLQARSTSWHLGFLRILSSLICQIWTFLSRFYLSPQWGPSDWWLLLLIFLTEENGCSPLCDSLEVLRGTVMLPLSYLQSSPGPLQPRKEVSWQNGCLRTTFWSGSQRRFLKDSSIILHTFFFRHQELVQEASLASPTYIQMLLSYTPWGHPCSS